MADSVNTPILCDQVPRMGNKCSQWLGASYLRLMGWRYSGQFPCLSKMIIIVAPHTSNWDFILGLAVAFNLRLKITFFGKASIFVPLLGRLFKRLGGVPIERSQTHGVVDTMATKMREAQQMVLCLSPEGTRSPIFPWKTGFLHIAHKANVPVFLVAFDYKKKLIEFGPVMDISDNTQSELDKIYQYYTNTNGKFPEKMVTQAMPTGDKIEK